MSLTSKLAAVTDKRYKEISRNNYYMSEYGGDYNSIPEIENKPDVYPGGHMTNQRYNDVQQPENVYKHEKRITKLW